MLAALDLLSAANLINYYGRHDEVDRVEVSPILIRKGEETQVALYGMGSMRDERLNRMWSKKKVTFLRPTSDLGKSGDGDEDGEDAKVSNNIGEARKHKEHYKLTRTPPAELVQHLLAPPEPRPGTRREELRPRVHDPRVAGPGRLGARARVHHRAQVRIRY